LYCIRSRYSARSRPIFGFGRIGVSEKAKRILCWEPKYEIDYIIDDTLRFIRKNMRV
jgi:nucleoside-diphosphate-sugar epimerase